MWSSTGIILVAARYSKRYAEEGRSMEGEIMNEDYVG